MDDYSSVIYRNNHRAVRLPSTPHEVEITKNLTDEEHEALQVVDVYKKTQLNSIHPWMDLNDEGMLSSLWGRASFCEGNTGPDDTYYNPVFRNITKANRVFVSLFGRTEVSKMSYWFLQGPNEANKTVTIITQIQLGGG
ncbi:MAG TPA: hypothetical protein EYN67_00860 [Flavobacteriales bacterium]|nr:hypothetical protein [Flavobacteriales bacterium]